MVYDPRCLLTLAGFGMSCLTGHGTSGDVNRLKAVCTFICTEEQTILHPFCRLPHDA